jgi:alkanesulfonate monooxygenase SsuD/methylene tetrahydromethanopterin reductase-like flavin-dependent oxidoreductase (luciferase family)
LAKQVATVDQVSGGRFVLGIGFGWSRAEAADHGVDFASRRAVAREKVLAMHALWSEDVAEYHGRYVDLPPSYAWPKPLQQPRVRTLIGGAAGPVLFASVAEYADGWMPIGGAGVAGAMGPLRHAMVEAGRDAGALEVVPFGTVPDEGKLDHYASIGCTEVVLRIPSGNAPDMLRTMDEYARFVRAR